MKATIERLNKENFEQSMLIAQLQQENIALKEICGKSALLNKHLTEATLELDMARGERDVVTKRMIQLEQLLAQAISDLKALDLECDYCLHNVPGICPGAEDDVLCDVCTHAECPCNACRDRNKWVWRGSEGK